MFYMFKYQTFHDNVIVLLACILVFIPDFNHGDCCQLHIQKKW